MVYYYEMIQGVEVVSNIQRKFFALNVRTRWSSAQYFRSIIQANYYQIQATGQGNYLVLLALILVCLLNSLALVPFFQVYRWFVNAACPVHDHRDETHVAS